MMQVHLDHWPGWEGSAEVRRIGEPEVGPPTAVSATPTHEAVVAVWQLESARVVAGLARMTRDLHPRRGPRPGRPGRGPGVLAARRRTRQPRRLADDGRQAPGRRHVPPRRAAPPGGGPARPRPFGGVHGRAGRPGRPRRGRRAAADVLDLPPGADAGVAGRADAAVGRRADDRGDRAGLPGQGHRRRAAHLARQEDAGRGRRGVGDADRARADRASGRRDGRDLPGLQRGVRRHGRLVVDAHRPLPRGAPALADAGGAGAVRRGGARPAGPARAPGLALPRPHHAIRGAGPARGPGPRPLGPPADPARPGRARPRRGHRVSPSGVYTVQAAIAACHARARRAEDTDWRASPGSTTCSRRPATTRLSRSTGPSPTAAPSARLPGSRCSTRSPTWPGRRTSVTSGTPCAATSSRAPVAPPRRPRSSAPPPPSPATTPSVRCCSDARIPDSP